MVPIAMFEWKFYSLALLGLLSHCCDVIIRVFRIKEENYVFIEVFI
jgi:hypothetical protein